jgi:dihydrofolate reductase
MKISLICAFSENGVIGKNNTMPWRLGDDLKNFKQITSNHCVIMGRKTYQSIGKALPHRTNIILTHQKDFQAKDTNIFHTKQDALAFAKSISETEIFIIGGAEIYTLFLEDANMLYLSHIHTNITDGDAFFPIFEEKKLLENNWQIKKSVSFEKSEKNDFDFTFKIWKKL